MVLPTDVLSILYGTWQLVNITKLVNNTLVPNPSGVGYAPTGLLQYSTTGYMSADIMATEPSDRPMDIDYPAKANDSISDWAEVGSHTLNYAGPWSVSYLNSSTTGQLWHGPMTVANVPSWVGTKQARNFTLIGTGEGRKGIGRYLLIGQGTTCGQCGLWWRKIA